MVPVRRVVAVTFGLMGAGMICGAAAGAAAVTLLLLAGGAADFLIEGFLAGGLTGAAFGMLTAPILSWLLLRRVPLGRMFLVCSVGAMLGGILGAVPGAFVGCVAAAVILHVMAVSGTQRA